MADVEITIHEGLLATAEPDEESIRRFQRKVLGLVGLVSSAMFAVEWVVCLYFALTRNPTLPVLGRRLRPRDFSLDRWRLILLRQTFFLENCL